MPDEGGNWTGFEKLGLGLLGAALVVGLIGLIIEHWLWIVGIMVGAVVLLAAVSLKAVYDERKDKAHLCKDSFPAAPLSEESESAYSGIFDLPVSHSEEPEIADSGISDLDDSISEEHEAADSIISGFNQTLRDDIETFLERHAVDGVIMWMPSA